MKVSSAAVALKQVLAQKPTETIVIHHSDRGIQYCSNEYVSLLKEHNAMISMTESGDPLENAIAERVNGILKDELLQLHYSSFQEAQKSVAKAISVYNSLRPHSSCAMLTPQVAHQQKGVLKKHWKNYYKQKEVVMAEP